MKFPTLLILGLLAICGLGNAFARDPLFGRQLHQQATAGASGSQSASASAQASNVNGQQQASTDAQATGAGATTFGASVANGDVDTCISGPNQNYSECRTFAPRVRTEECTDVPPDDSWTCEQQSNEFGKCDNDFIFVGAWCLKSCGRCGDGCVDVAPQGGSCDESKCDSEEYTGKPLCLKTCGRCSTVASV